jgi:hypothetical protein
MAEFLRLYGLKTLVFNAVSAVSGVGEAACAHAGFVSDTGIAVDGRRTDS